MASRKSPAFRDFRSAAPRSNPGTPRPRAALFDIGATLVTGPPVAPNKVIASLLGGVGPAEVASVIMTCELASAEAACEALELRFGAIGERAKAGIAELWQMQSSAAAALDGASETVLALKRRGIRIGLLSDIWSPYYTGIERAVPEVVSAADAIVLSCRTGARKPDAANFVTALGELGVEPSEAVMVGDTYAHDILPALKLGMRAVWVLARPEREADSIIQVLNGDLPAPTATVLRIGEVAALALWD
jgi:HAD superfamily hydrolase (TIGR01509 family)